MYRDSFEKEIDMKLLLYSDCHGDASTAGMPRIDDYEEALRKVTSIAVEHQVALVAFLGDLCDPDAGSIYIRVIDAMINQALLLKAHGIDQIFIAGNHDVCEDGSGRTTIHPLRHFGNVAERPKTYLCKDANVICLPYPSRGAKYDPAQYVKNSRERSALADKVIVLGHMTGIDGVEVGSETRDFARGSTMPFPLEECRQQGVSFMANGHFHKQQVTPGGIHIPGSLLRLRFDEENNEPGILLLEI